MADSRSTPEALIRDKIIQLGKKSFSCAVCTYTTERPGDIRRHVELVHFKVKKYACDYCGAQFGQKHHRFRHEKTCKSKQAMDAMLQRSVIPIGGVTEEENVDVNKDTMKSESEATLEPVEGIVLEELVKTHIGSDGGFEKLDDQMIE